MFFSKGMIAGILGVVVIIIVLFFATGMNGSSNAGPVVPAQKCADTAVAYANANLVQPGTTVTLDSVTEEHELYRISVNYQSQSFSLFTSKDCTLLFTTTPVNMAAPRPTPAPTKAPVKTVRPTVDLYSMAFCPFGTQAETAIRPVYDLLGSKADFRIRFITTPTGTTIDTVSSLHGPAEVKEDAFQVCVAKTQPTLYWEYVRLFNEQCYPQWTNTASLDTCRKNVTSLLKINHATIETCSQGADGFSLLQSDSEAADRDGAFSSPTLIINGVEYRGARTPEAYKQAICNSFETAPEECKTTLSTTAATASGSC
ncbi:MAG: thioredoxin domain-containing protein [Methanomicrobiales archaeon]|nr:thioredoxin domain-containing protein [Methanomicrobiales archaeon]